MMMDWNAYEQQVLSTVGELAKLSPDTVISLAVAVTTRCDGCITIHTHEAYKLGATREEISEALGVAVAMNAGAALVYSTRVLDAYDAKAASDKK
jgi:AhpD family alkylhydroperoxidase